MKKSNKQVNQKQKKSILNASRMLRNMKGQFGGSTDVRTETYHKKGGFWKVFFPEQLTFMEIKGFRVSNMSKADALATINPAFVEEVAKFLENEPNNVHAQNITKTLIKGVSF